MLTGAVSQTAPRCARHGRTPPSIVRAFGQPDGNGSLALDVWQHGVVLYISVAAVLRPLATEEKLAELALKRI
jgi:hypothetical protein